MMFFKHVTFSNKMQCHNAFVSNIFVDAFVHVISVKWIDGIEYYEHVNFVAT